MPTTHDDHASAPVPALLRAARGSYGDATRRGLAAAGFDDLPRNGGFVVTSLVYGGSGDAGDVVRALKVSKQAASQLIDTLVLRGYIERSTNPDDRRRMQIVVTERGRAAAEAVSTACDTIDDELAAMVTPKQLAGMKAGLAALAEIRERHLAAG